MSGELLHWNSPLLRQIWIVAAVLLSILGQGMKQGYMSVMLTGLQKPDASIHVDLTLTSWLASSAAMSLIFGAASATFYMEIWGRKIAYILEIVPSIISVILVYFSTNFYMLLVARILDGATIGGMGATAVVVIGEYTDPSNRTMFLNLKTGSVCLGITIMHGLGYFIHWKNAALVNLVPLVIAIFMVLTWKESPSWLASKMRFDECERTFIWFRGDSEKSKRELKRLIRSQAIKQVDTNAKCDKVTGIFKKFVRKDFWKPVLILVIGFMLIEASGQNILGSYINDIVKGVIGKDDRSWHFFYTIAIDLISTVSSTCSGVLIKFMNTRTLLFSSAISSVIVLGNGCLYLFLVSRGVISNEMTWIPVSLFIVFFILTNMGCTTIPLTLAGEIIPLEHKSCVMFVACIGISAVAVISLKSFPYLMISFNLYGAFTVLGCVTITVIIILYFILPETKGRTLQEIEDCIKNCDEIIDEESNLVR